MSFTIRELESISGIRAHTIRIWEQRYNFLKPSRTVTNIRTYNNDELKTLLTVALLNRYGYKISRIDSMDESQRHDAILNLPDQNARTESLVNRMIGHMVELEGNEFEALLNEQIREFGFESTITELIFHFLDKVGIFWQTNRIMPAQEHLVSNIIRQKIVVAIDRLPFVTHPGPAFLLFLPEDEHHEMGLLFVSYLLKKSGRPVIYLGANVPLNDVGYLADLKKPGWLYLHLTSFPRRHNFPRFISSLVARAPQSQIIISGPVAQAQKKSLPEGVNFLSSFEEVKRFLEELP